MGGHMPVQSYQVRNHSFIKEYTTMLRSFFAKEEGQGLVEYALILVLIAIVVIGILTFLGGQVSEVFSEISSGME
jgi:pilus assembly protein Flp/PilA